MKIAILLLFLSLFVTSPVYAKSSNEIWVLEHLKKIAGVIGASQACNNASQSADAIRVHNALIDSAIKNGVLLAEDKPFISDMTRKTALEIEGTFRKNPPIECEEVSIDFEKFKKEIDINPLENFSIQEGIADAEMWQIEIRNLALDILNIYQKEAKMIGLLKVCERKNFPFQKEYLNKLTDVLTEATVLEFVERRKGKPTISEDLITVLPYQAINTVLMFSVGVSSAMVSAGAATEGVGVNEMPDRKFCASAHLLQPIP